MSAHALKVLIVLLYLQKAKQKYRPNDEFAIVQVSQKSLMEKTGYKRRTITKAIKELKETRYVSVMYDRKGSRKNGSGAAEYVLRIPDPWIPMKSHALRVQQGSNLLFANGIQYFTLPMCLITEPTARWFLANLSGSQTKLYLTILAKVPGKVLRIPALELQKLCSLSAVTFKKTVEGLEELGLIQIAGFDRTEKLRELNEFIITICDPYTGEPFHVPDDDDEDDPANYYTTNAKNVTKRLILNAGTPEQMEDLIRSCVRPGDPIIAQQNGDLTIRCPYHDDNSPSLSVSPTKRCFQCFGCKETGTLTKLVETLSGGTKATAITKIALATGQTAEFKEPDSRAIAKYNYRDSKGNLLKQVLRYPNTEDGQKVIRQRKPRSGGWVWNVNGLPPMLYHAEYLDSTMTVNRVVIVEGEKDCDTIHKVYFPESFHPCHPHTWGQTVAVTSGGAGTWDPVLAKLLVPRRAVVLPDNDAAGAMYAKEVIQSLEVEGINYQVLSLEGTGCKDATEYHEKYGSQALSDFIDYAGSPVCAIEDEGYEEITI